MTNLRQVDVRLSFLDVVSLVVGAIIGADIYVVAGIGALLVGPALLVDWVLAGVVASLIVLCFAQCAAIEPAAGGPYAYVETTLGAIPALIVGVALYLAEWSALAVFPVAVVGYLAGALDLGAAGTAAFKVAFVAFLTATNLLGVRAAGTVDDLLTAAKLIPLAVLIGAVAVVAAQHPAV
ncbi:MAG TPA: amino acid permease, partial [Chloroflexota bacterium]|nr:amino acid permease [Chloroflexota bacterium]